MTTRKGIPLILVACVLGCFFYFHLYRYFNFESLRFHRFLLLQWKEEHYFLTVLIFISFYCLSVTTAFPGIFFLSLTSGFLFGPLAGTVYVLLSASIGSVLFYFSVKLALAEWFKIKIENWIKPLEPGLDKNAFYYLLFLRLVPIFPFSIINAAAGLFNLPLSTFISATILGLTPGTIIYTSLGKNLNTLFELNQAPDFNILLNPSFFLPLLALGILAILPLCYFKKN